ncbi:MAG: lytic transglycosylase domain-containing protein [Actinomycetia bacterium]|nr:lytic transglycosylase domain-containing protein [Actinomycetes bacterium]
MTRRRGVLGAMGVLGAVGAGLALVVTTAVGGAVVLDNRAAGRVPEQYRDLVVSSAATCQGLPASVLAAQLAQESGWDPRAVSPKGARGIAQFMPATWKAHGIDGNGDGRVDIWDPADAIPSAARFNCLLLDEVDAVPGDRLSLMLAAYNAGPTSVRRAGGVPDFPETRGYVSSILRRAGTEPFASLG